MIRPQPECGLFAVAHGLVEVRAGRLLHVRVVAGGIAIGRLLAVHDRPDHAACLFNCCVAGEILAVPEAERPVLLEHRLVPVVVGPREQVPHAHALGHLDHLPGVLARLAGRIDHLVPLLRASFGVAEDTFALDPAAAGRIRSAIAVVGVG